MPLDESAAAKRLPALVEWLKRAANECKAMFPGVKYSDDDDFAFMALCFFGKQLDHAESLLRLVPLKDSVLIARCMVEGLCQLLWAAGDMKIRPVRWRAFAAVHDFRRLHRSPAVGWTPSAEDLQTLQDALRESEDLILSKKAKALRTRGQPLPSDPYHRDWRAGETITDIIRSVGDPQILDFAYGPYSSWAHWSPESFGDRLEGHEAGITYRSPVSHLHASFATAVATPCLLQTAHLLGSHLELPQVAAIEQLRDHFAEWYNSLKSSPNGEA